MNAEPTQYRQANMAQRYDAKKIIGEFADVIQFRSDGKDSLMDVGCGTGDVLMDFVLPILPKNYSKVVGTDILPTMVQYSRESYAEHDRVEFKVLDIGTDSMPLEFHEQFDHVTSFFCLHWLQDQRQALKNINDMLKNGGDCLLVFIAGAPGLDSYYTLAADPKWYEYMKDVDSIVPLLNKHKDHWLVYTKLLQEIGFTDFSVEIRHKAFAYEGYEGFKNFVVSVTPFVQRVPLDKREEYVKDLCQQWKAFCVCDDQRYMSPYAIVVAYAKK